MKAAIMYAGGAVPEYRDVPVPVPANGDEVLVKVKAVALKHFDKGRAKGTHYSAAQIEEEGRIPGGDGVCLLADGRRVYGMGISGMMAEQALIEADRIIALPHGLSDAAAAALPNAVIGAAMGLKFKAGLLAGEVVLINGATGFTGRVAVQLARHYGAKRVIVTGRNAQSLQDLLAMGADEAISLMQDDDALMAQLQGVHTATPIDVIIDYLWGHTAEMILASLKGKGNFTHITRFVSVGSMSGDVLQLSAANLRSVNLQLTGSGLGSWTKEQVKHLFSHILPEAFQLAADGKLNVDTIEMKLEDIAGLWDKAVPDGRRLVVLI